MNLFKTQLFHIAEELSETTTDGQGNPIIPDGTSNETLKLIDQLKEQIDTVAAQFDSKIGQTLNEVEKASENAKTVSRQLIKEHDNDANAHELAFKKHGIKDGSASVAGGDVTHTAYFQERKSGIFFASAGFLTDFDTWYAGETYKGSNKSLPAIYGYNTGNNSYVGKNINMSEFYASVYHEYYKTGTSIFKLKISDSQFLTIYLASSDNTEKTLELYQSTTRTEKGTLIGTATNDEAFNSYTTLELYIDLISKQLKVYQLVNNSDRWLEWSFDISELVLTNNVVECFYWMCHYNGNRYLQNLALSTSRIKQIQFRGLYATSLGDYTDFDKEGSSSIIGTCYTSETGVSASEKDSRQTYYMLSPSNSQVDSKATILGLFTNVITKGDSVTALTDIIRFNGVDYEGLSAVASPNQYCRFQRIFETNPNTGAKWEVSDLGKIQLGCRILGEPIE